MNKTVKKIKKIKADIDNLEAKEEILLEKLDEAIDELEDSLEDQDVESRSSVFCADGWDSIDLFLSSDLGTSLTFFNGLNSWGVLLLP